MKPKFFLDYDATLVDSLSAICEVYNNIFQHHPEFNEAIPENVTTWNMKEVVPLVSDINVLFGSSLFFDLIKPMDKYTIPVLREMSLKYELIVCSIGVPSNISLKALNLQKTFPMISKAIWLQSSDCKMEKGNVNMADSYFLDDVASNLTSSNAKTKVLFGKRFEWNKDWNGLHLLNWKDVGNEFL